MLDFPLDNTNKQKDTLAKKNILSLIKFIGEKINLLYDYLKKLFLDSFSSIKKITSGLTSYKAQITLSPDIVLYLLASNQERFFQK